MAVLKKLLWIIALMAGCMRAEAQQDPQFGLGFLNRVFTNPGDAGNTREGLFCATAANRLGLTSFDGAPVASVVSLHGPITLFGISGGVGITLYNDLAGALNAPGVGLTYAYRRPLHEGTLGVGLTLGVLTSWYTSADWRLPEGNADPALPSNETAGVNFDAAIGAHYHSETWFGGLSLKHLTAPRLGVDKVGSLPRTLYLNAGYRYAPAESNWAFTPMAEAASDFAQISWWLQATAWYKERYWAGLGYRWGQALQFMAGIELFEGVRVAYAYEYLTSQLDRFSGGCHELVLSYSFSLTIPPGSQRYKSVRYL